MRNKLYTYAAVLMHSVASVCLCPVRALLKDSTYNLHFLYADTSSEYLGHFLCQGHWVKVKVTGAKLGYMSVIINMHIRGWSVIDWHSSLVRYFS